MSLGQRITPQFSNSRGFFQNLVESHIFALPGLGASLELRLPRLLDFIWLISEAPVLASGARGFYPYFSSWKTVRQYSISARKGTMESIRTMKKFCCTRFLIFWIVKKKRKRSPLGCSLAQCHELRWHWNHKVIHDIWDFKTNIC